jgi:hypothetical protein
VVAGPLEAVLGGVDELIVLKCLAGLLVHCFESSFLGLCAAEPRGGIARERMVDAECLVYQPQEGYGLLPASCM